MCNYPLYSATNRAGKITAPINYTLRSMILRSDVSCRNGVTNDDFPAVCPWKGQLSDWIERHNNQECQFNVVKCPFTGCQVRCVRKDLKTHQTTCPYEPVTCSHRSCDLRIARKDLASHEASCPNAMVTCRNASCNQRMRRLDVEGHLKYHCPFVTCPFVGCDFVCTRQDMMAHLKACPCFVVKCPLGCDFWCARKKMWKHVWCRDIPLLVAAVLLGLFALVAGWYILTTAIRFGFYVWSWLVAGIHCAYWCVTTVFGLLG